MKRKFVSLVIILALLCFNTLHSENNNSKKKILKNNVKKSYSKFNINNLSTFIYNNGDADIDPNGNSGLRYPNGSNKAVVFESGFVWGGRINGEIRVGGSTYAQGLLGGRILENGKPEDPNSESVRVYRVRPDYDKQEFSKEIIDEKKTTNELFQQYKKDWYEWPAQFGAPYYDVDENGIYDPTIDIPGVPGASQTLWYVANDLDSNQTKSLYGSLPMGVELQVTVWGYKDFEILENIMFKKFVLINKSIDNFEETYVSVWSDPDVGDAGDDYIGCDTNLSLGYAYNGDNDDGVYGTNVPAVGFKFLQGPLVDGFPDDKGRINGRTILGKQNLPMTSFAFFVGSDPVYNDPDLGSYVSGTLQYYRIMLGYISFGSYYPFALSGDPITQKGWYDGIIHPPGDRRFVLNSGPFTMAPGDTQEVIIAQIVAGGEPNTDRLQAVSLLKNYNWLAQEFYDFNYQQASGQQLVVPKVNKIELDEEIVLTWFDDENLAEIENSDRFNYSFQGYTVYQFPNDRFHKDEAKEILTYDVIDGVGKIISEVVSFEDKSKLYDIVKSGTDSGIKRHISIKKDYLKSETALNNGSKYYFGVSSYLVNRKSPIYPKIIESKISTITAIPQTPKPGNLYDGKYGTILDVHSNLDSDLNIIIKIVDPTKLKSNTYRITFNNSSTEINSWRNLTWNLFDSENNNLIENEKITVPDPFGKEKPVYINGLEIQPFVFDTTLSNPINTEDVFTFYSNGAVIGEPLLAKVQVEKVNVFPNPYYGAQSNEIHQFDKFVTFSHLPKKAKLRIFNLAGHLVRTLNKDNDSQFLIWNLTNESNFWVASGVYFVYIEMPEFGKTKILKLAIIMENVVPDFF